MGKKANTVFFGEGVVDPRMIFISDDPKLHLSAFLNALNEGLDVTKAKMADAGANADRSVMPVVTVSITVEGGKHHLPASDPIPSVNEVDAEHPPCCTACDGKGATQEGPCSDCLGTGHPHA